MLIGSIGIQKTLGVIGAIGDYIPIVMFPKLGQHIRSGVSRILGSFIPTDGVAAARVQRKPVGGISNGKDKVIPKQRPQTLDALFANMKEQRTRAMSQQTMHGGSRQTVQRRRAQWQRGRGGPAPGGNGRRIGDFGN